MPVPDPQKVARRLYEYDFTWDLPRALEMALFRTFASPKISGLLSATGEFGNRPQKRYDDTDITMSSILEHGYDSAKGQAWIAKLNSIHGRYDIANAEYLYVLSTFLFEPIRWSERYAWRAMDQGPSHAFSQGADSDR